MNSIQSEHFTKALFTLLDETFDNIHGFYLDKNASMFETLANITADEASIPVGGKCATLAAQVKHVAFHLDYIEKYSRDPNPPKVDWGEIWRTVNRVTPEEWQSIQSELRTDYNRILNLYPYTRYVPRRADYSQAIKADTGIRTIVEPKSERIELGDNCCTLCQPTVI